MTPEIGTTAVVVRVPVAEPLVLRVPTADDPTGANEVPAHVTLLWPFLALSDLTDADLADLALIVADQPAFEVTFSRLGRFEDVLWLAPDPPEPFVALTRAIAARWPSHPPYQGRFGSVTPHLTLANDIDPDGDQARDVAVQAQAALPLRFRVDEAELIAFWGTRFEVVRVLPLG